ncbi:MAG: hypothetical protein HYU80_04560 [Candidatus Blackburnbacteria bacterium]|nr:hypothetical protein [Candidatus Blackburnbacteria bacterium]
MAETALAEVDVTKQPPCEPFPRKETKERDDGLLIPRIEDYPTKARVRVIDNHRVAVPLFQKAERMLDGLNLFAETMEETTEGEKSQLERAKLPTQEMVDRADEQIAKIQGEFELLYAIHERLRRGEDCSKLLLSASPLMGTDSLTPFDREQFAENLKSGFRFRQRIRPLLKNTAHEARLRSQLQLQKNAFARRTHNFVSALVEPVSHPLLEAEIEQIRPEDFVGKSPSYAKSHVESATADFWSQAREVARAGAATWVYRGKIQEWVDSSRDKLDSMDVSWTFDTRLNSLDSTFAKNEELFAQEVEAAPKESVEKVVHTALAEVGKTLSDAGQAYVPWDPAEKSAFMIYEWTPLEAVLIAESLNPKIERSLEVARKYSVADANSFQYTYEHTSGGLVEGGRLRSEENRAFPNSRELFWHVAPYGKMKEILRRGVLASRRAQIDRYGESYFHSGGGIRTTKDSVIVVDQFGYEKTIPKSEFKFNRGRGQGKHPNQEMYQVCFSQNWPYFYQDGVALVFSKASLCSKGQFFDRDGWHLFSTDYRDNEVSPGFEIELDKEPNMLIAVVGEKCEDLKRFLGKELGRTDQWISDNVVVVPSSPSGTFEIDLPKLQELFFSRHQVAVKQGVFIPTGEMGDHGGGGVDPLYTYKALS